MATSSSSAKILLPLYIYPNPGAWEPLFQAIDAHPTLDFVVIVNPNSGPGAEPWWPNEDYVREISRLNAHANVQTVGYVSTDYCRKPVEKVLADVDGYARWSSDERFPGLAVSGIFFDETPNVFSEAAKAFLYTITSHVKGAGGILGDRTVVHNPGTAIDARLAVPGLDIATVAEMAYSDFTSEQHQAWLATSSIGRDQTSYMVYAVPNEVMGELVRSLRGMARYVYVTDREVDAYNGFGAGWGHFVEVMAGEVDSGSIS